MLRVIAVLIVSAVVVAIAWFVAHLPGHVGFRVGDITIEASAPVMALAGLVLLIALYALVRLIVGVLVLPRRLRRWSGERRRSQGDAAVSRALVALAAGDQGDARREAARARRLLGDTPQTLLLSAQAGRLAGRDTEAEAAFRALADRPDAAFLGLRGLLRQAVARQDWAEAAALAARAEAAHPGASWLREERAQLAIRSGHWKDALLLSGPDAPVAAYGAAAAAEESDPAEALRLARQAWKDDPTLAPAALAYAARLRQAGRESRAQSVLRSAWTAAPQPDIAEAALAPVADPLARLKAATRLVDGNPEHPESRLLLARCALAAGLTGEARRHAEAARTQLNQRRVWMLLAEVEEREHPEGERVREALRRAATADADPAWRCGACGATHAAWHPVCPVCSTPGRIRWESPAVSSLPVVAPEETHINGRSS